jgi:hypothetical protein
MKPNFAYAGITLPKIGLPDPYYKPRPWGVNSPFTDLAEKMRNTPIAMKSGAGKFRKGSPEAKAFMAKLRAMRKKKGAGSMRGLASYKKSKVRGSGVMDVISNLASSIGSSTEALLGDPTKLISLATTAAPAALSGIRHLLGLDKREAKKAAAAAEAAEAEKEAKMLQYLSYLKKTNKKKYKKMLKKYEAYKESKMFGDISADFGDLDDDIDDDDDDNDMDEEETKPKSKSSRKEELIGFD